MPFKPEPSITWVPATREQIVALIEGINQPQVSIPGRTPQQVTGHLLGVRNANGSFSIYVGLHVPRTGENVVYVHDGGPVGVEGYTDVEIEGLHFLESMGFMLDNLNFRNLSPEAQEETVRRMPLLSKPRPPGEGTPGALTARPAAADPTRVARLLASF